MRDAYIRCLCCNHTFEDIAALNEHRATDGRDEGETWVVPHAWDEVYLEVSA